MLIGILSDTHGRADRAAAAARLLIARGARALVHCGDIGGEGVLQALALLAHPAGVPVHAVPGNCDYDRPAAPGGMGVTVHGVVARLVFDGVSVAVTHGHDYRALDELIRGGRHAYVLTGHTHVAANEAAGPTRIINPGALHRAATPSCALLDTATGAVEFLPVTD